MYRGQAVRRPRVVCVLGGHGEKALISEGVLYKVSWRPTIKPWLRPAGAKMFKVNS